MRRVGAYPWEELATVSRGAARNERRLRRAISPQFPLGPLAPLASLARIAEASSEILSAEVRVELRRSPAPEAVRPSNSVFLEAADGSLSTCIELEPALSTLILARILGRRPELTKLDAPLDDAARGALSAVLVEVARRALANTALRARPEMPRLDDAARFDAAVIVDARPYRVALAAVGKDGPTAAPEHDTHLASLGDLPLRLEVVAAVATTPRRELATLAPGDVWLPGAGWLGLGDGSDGCALPSEPSRHALARAALSAPSSEHGVEVGRSDDGRLVLRGGIIALAADVTDVEAGRGGGDEPMSGPDETLTELVLEAPVVVRVEVASVTLSAREWASLRPGDVLETGLRIAEPAVLRVAGREVARGELVSVDGELGVRIREILHDEPPE